MAKNISKNKKDICKNDDLLDKLSQMCEHLSALSEKYEENVNQFSKVNGLYEDSIRKKESFDEQMKNLEEQINDNIDRVTECNKTIDVIKINLRPILKELEAMEDNVKKMKECIVLINEFEQKRSLLENKLNDLSKLYQIINENFSEQSRKVSEFTESNVYKFMTENNKNDIMNQIVNHVVNHVELYIDGLFGSKKCRLEKK